MSTFENKVEVVTDFLRNRASLRRLTDYQEVSRVAGEVLHRRGQRHHAAPVDREKIAGVLKKVDDDSVENQGFMLSAIVVHFWDNEAGHRFFDRPTTVGSMRATPIPVTGTGCMPAMSRRRSRHIPNTSPSTSTRSSPTTWRTWIPRRTTRMPTLNTESECDDDGAAKCCPVVVWRV